MLGASKRAAKKHPRPVTMIETTEIRVPELLGLVEKGGDITMTEKSRLDHELSLLSQIDSTTAGRLTGDQAQFARRVLPVYIQHRVPQLADVMAVYGLTMDTVFYHETEPYGGRWAD